MSSMKLLQCRTCYKVFFFDSDAELHEIEYQHRAFIEIGTGAPTSWGENEKTPLSSATRVNEKNIKSCAFFKSAYTTHDPVHRQLLAVAVLDR